MKSERYLDTLRTIRLGFGAHANPEQGMCAMEAVAYIAGEKHSDAPMCADEKIILCVRNMNDRMTPTQRNKYLAPLIFDIPGTRHPNGRVFIQSLSTWMTPVTATGEDPTHQARARLMEDAYLPVACVNSDEECERAVAAVRKMIAVYRDAPVEPARDPNTLPCLVRP